ncbi:MAG: type IX secretion system protein PorQ [Flavobacteriales bacterium]|nr:type IX secretion system protein PorQ [Flavobacteriales bacterium]
MLKFNRKFLFISVYLLSQSNLFAQIGGTRTYPFLNLDHSARVAAAGGSLITIRDNDISLAYQNPALLNKKMHNHATLSYLNYLAGINMGFGGYARHFDSLGTFSANVFFVDYGKIQGYDEDGNSTRPFTAQDYNFQIGYGNHWKDKFYYGLNFNFIYSALEAYVSTAGAFNLGGIYFDDEKQFSATLLVKNLGVQFIPYRDGHREDLPLDIQLGISKKLKFNPLRFSIIAHDLQTWDISYVNPNKRNKTIDLATQKEKVEKIPVPEKIMRHLNFTGELLFSDNFNMILGYNYQRRKELSPEQRKVVTGFSWGLTFNLLKYRFTYGMASFYPGQPTFNFSVLKNLNDFRRTGSKS